MTNKNVNNWIMYHEIHKLCRLGFSNAKIARPLIKVLAGVAKEK
ncbi:MAG TPA: hypothetical protein VMU83_23790 [Hanamia sp.]|nr:hypothetical protein [Hanamia sp.]